MESHRFNLIFLYFWEFVLSSSHNYWGIGIIMRRNRRSRSRPGASWEEMNAFWIVYSNYILKLSWSLAKLSCFFKIWSTFSSISLKGTSFWLSFLLPMSYSSTEPKLFLDGKILGGTMPTSGFISFFVFSTTYWVFLAAWASLIFLFKSLSFYLQLSSFCRMPVDT